MTEIWRLLPVVVCLVLPEALTETGQSPPNGKKLSAAQGPVRTDRDGEPLPDEVAARMGSGRLRGGWRIAFSPDGKFLASGGDGSIRVWDAATGRLKRRFRLGRDWGYLFAFSADGSTLTTAQEIRSEGVGQRILHVASGNQGPAQRLGDPAGGYGLTVSPDGKWVAFGTKDGTFKIYRADDGKEVLRVPLPGAEHGRNPETGRATVTTTNAVPKAEERGLPPTRSSRLRAAPWQPSRPGGAGLAGGGVLASP